MTAQCESCRHDYNDHGRHGGRCSHNTFTEERIESDDTVEIRRGFDRCDCGERKHDGSH